jgi:hypothetical protein
MNLESLLDFFKKEEDFSLAAPIAFFEMIKEDSHELIFLLNLKREAILSFLCERSKVQESFLARSAHRAEQIAHHLIDDKGDLDKEKLDTLARLLKKEPYVSFLEGCGDREISQRIVYFFEMLENDRFFIKNIYRFFLPMTHQGAEKLVRNTLGYPHDKALTTADLRRAVLSACFTLLRQSVGSCFASAPAILIHNEQIELFLEDLYQLLMTGRLKRVREGMEYSVPLSPSWGIGDLKKPLFLGASKSEPWFSPGLIAAFSAVGVIDEKLMISEKIDALKALLSLHAHGGKVIDSETLIRRALLSHHQLKEEDLEKEKQSHFKPILERDQTIFFTAPGDVAKRYHRFLLDEERAKAAFMRIVDHPLLKAWEFTVASFAEYKTEFSTWNLYVSLGFDPKEGGGIGEILYRNVDAKLQENQEKAAEHQREYERAASQVNMIINLLRSATSQAQVRRLQAEQQILGYQITQHLDNRDKYYALAKHYSLFFSFLIEQYYGKFPLYFQEIYDPKLHEAWTSSYDDSPAGFRLVYKHGRHDASLWTLIQDESQYIESLCNFFQLIEPQIEVQLEDAMQKKELTELTTAIIHHLQTKEFLESAFRRIKKAYGEDGEKKPWAYTSGGSMEHLLKIYFKKEGEMKKETKVPQNSSDLLVFILESFKELPASVIELYRNNEIAAMLMTSPTHAFNLRPGLEAFENAWEDRGFTYTWVRDRLIEPRRKFYRAMTFSPGEQEFIAEEYAETLPSQLSHFFMRYFRSLPGHASTIEMKRSLFEAARKAGESLGIDARSIFEENIDSFLFQSLPLIDSKVVVEKLSLLLDTFSKEEIESVLHDRFFKRYLRLTTLLDIAKIISLSLSKSAISSFDLSESLIKKAREKAMAPPEPLLFADTNWTDSYFAFLINPGTLDLELWKTNLGGVKGAPIKGWIGQEKGPPWTIFTRPYEYRI